MSIADLLLMELHTAEKTKQKNMDIINLLLKELEAEFNITKKFLAIVPIDKFDWAPHEKSMKMKSLVVHIVDLPSWISLALTTKSLILKRHLTPSQWQKVQMIYLKSWRKIMPWEKQN